MSADIIYQSLLNKILKEGDEITTRNSETFSDITISGVTFKETPLVTVRKTAWKKAIREMEWFMSGNDNCPEELLSWWEGQLDKNGDYRDGYARQFRWSRLNSIIDELIFDQIKFILNSLKTNPNSRRLILTSWNPGEMAYITEVNNNPNTPTTCHNTCTQFFVRNGALHLKTYQRSADMLLGVPHNWIQTWALLLYFAYHSNLDVGTLQWSFGDAHIYKEDSHLTTANEIIDLPLTSLARDIPTLVYSPMEIEYDDSLVPIFKTSDFFMEGEIPDPLVTGRPKLI
jgi:thymidylate synthase